MSLCSHTEQQLPPLQETPVTITVAHNETNECTPILAALICRDKAKVLPKLKLLLSSGERVNHPQHTITNPLLCAVLHYLWKEVPYLIYEGATLQMLEPLLDQWILAYTWIQVPEAGKTKSLIDALVHYLKGTISKHYLADIFTFELCHENQIGIKKLLATDEFSSLSEEEKQRTLLFAFSYAAEINRCSLLPDVISLLTNNPETDTREIKKQLLSNKTLTIDEQIRAIRAISLASKLQHQMKNFTDCIITFLPTTHPY